MSVEDMINEGVRRAYKHEHNKLRASILADPAGARKNTHDNTPAVIDLDRMPGDKVEVLIAAKGGGWEAKSKFAMLKPSDSIVDWVLKMVPQMGAGWCPPGPIFMSVMAWVGPNGTATKVVKAASTTTNGATQKITASASAGMMSSLSNSLMASAMGCIKPCGPTRIGPSRTCMCARIFRSSQFIAITAPDRPANTSKM